MWWIVLVAIVSVVTPFSDASVSNKKHRYNIVCYLGSWANYRNGDGKFRIEDIDASLCTHLVYGFAKLGHDGRIAAYDPYLDLKENWGLGAYERFTGLKKQHGGLKTLLAIGGWNEGSTKYSSMARHHSSRQIFIESCVEFLKKYDFDGLDLDWEYPAMRGGKPEDKKNFALLLKEMKEAFKPHHLLLTAAVSAGKNTIDQAYDIPALGKHLDLINLMAYDFHGGWDTTTGHNSPLYARPEETDTQKQLNVDYSVNYWLQKGAPADKLILGMPLYGRSFTLQDPLNPGLDVPVTGRGMAGEFTREQGYLGYNEICTLLQNERDWTITVNKHIRAPYAFKERQWIGYDDVKSISEKVAYLVKKKLGGAMVWSIETDDFHGKCHNGLRYPLLHAINAGLNGTKFDDDNSIFLTRGSTAQTRAWSWKTPYSSTSSSRSWFWTESSTKKLSTTTSRPSTKRLTTNKLSTKKSSATTSRTSTRKSSATTNKPSTKMPSATTKKSSTRKSSATTSKPSTKRTSATTKKSSTRNSSATTSKQSTRKSSTATSRTYTKKSTATTSKPYTKMFFSTNKISTQTSSAITNKPSTPVLIPETTETPLKCTKTGYFRHPTDCKLFYLCQPLKPGHSAGFKTYLFRCGKGTAFSELMSTCYFSQYVPGCNHIEIDD